MKQRTSQSLYEYWNEVRGSRLAPRRFEIEPARIAPILAETFILERADAETFRFRIAGTRLCDQFGAELRGTNFLQFWTDADRLALEADLAAVCERGGVLVLTFEASSDWRHRVAFEAVLLPLMHTDKSVNRILGAMSTLTSPPWLGTERLVSKLLVDHAVVWPDGAPTQIGVDTDTGGKTVYFQQRRFRVLDGGRSGATGKS